MSGALRRAAERVIVGTGLADALRRMRRGRVLVLAYHNVVPDGTGPIGDSSLHLELIRFRSHLDLLIEAAAVIPLASAAAGKVDSSRPNVVITFDDAYQGAVTLALPELARRKLPATIFVPPGLLGSRSVWWDEAAAVGGLNARTRASALSELAGVAERVRPVLTPAGSPALPVTLGIATHAELRAAVSLGGMTVGAHTWSHPNLTAVTDAELAHELSSVLDWLRIHHAPNLIPWVAYPYGLADTRVFAAARAAGYEGGLLVSGGWWPRAVASQMNWPRLNVPSGMSSDRLAIRLSGIGA